MRPRLRITLGSALGIVIGGIPLLALLLTPTLMRSRAGSESSLIIGTTLLLLLLAALAVAAPPLAAWFAPAHPHWTARGAARATGRAWRQHPRRALGAAGLAVAIYAVGQIAGLALAEILPYALPAPGGGWDILYERYALQAVLVFACAAYTAYALGIRGIVSRTAAASSPPREDV